MAILATGSRELRRVNRRRSPRRADIARVFATAAGGWQTQPHGICRNLGSLSRLLQSPKEWWRVVIMERPQLCWVRSMKLIDVAVDQLQEIAMCLENIGDTNDEVGPIWGPARQNLRRLLTPMSVHDPDSVQYAVLKKEDWRP